MSDQQDWERSTRRVHFVCGILVGGLIGLRIGWSWLSDGPRWLSALSVAGFALGCGGFAWKYLDEFWHGLLRWFGR
ncbi:MAG TPA: hypothetical protein VN887_10615 [Candidatus Angelobacter sp.]|nr:hypothetical protein [Candidatus Angelobacter sp.]